MALKTIAGPFKTEEEAKETAQSLGNQYSWYSEYLTDSEGYQTKEKIYFVDFNPIIENNRIFGFDTKEFLKRQYK